MSSLYIQRITTYIALCGKSFSQSSRVRPLFGIAKPLEFLSFQAWVVVETVYVCCLKHVTPNQYTSNQGEYCTKYVCFFSCFIIWRFPRMGVLPNHPIIDRIFHERITIQLFFGYLHLWKTPLLNKKH